MKLSESMICLDCDEISIVANHCPACLSRSVVKLSTWLPPKDAAKMMIGKRENILAGIENMRRAMRDMLYELGEDPLGVGA